MGRPARGLLSPYRAVVFHNRDSGRSTECAQGYEVDDMARDTLALADELGLDDFHLLGVSLGARSPRKPRSRRPSGSARSRSP